MWGNTPVWDGIKRQSGCYVTFYEKYLNFEKKLASSWLAFLFPFLLNPRPAGGGGQRVPPVVFRK